MAGEATNPKEARKTWSREELRKRLSPLQFKVTQEEGTERPFENEYWNNKRAGIYVDVVSGEPLFSSLDKYDSGTGWPSFTRPLEPENIVTREDRKFLFMVRTEVRSRNADSHLGHVFDDGPAPDGKRYCMNSAAMRFIPAEDLEKEGYGKYLALFRNGSSADGSEEKASARKPGEDAENAPSASAGTGTAILAGGCFWGMEEIIRNIPGVIDTEVGYTGGDFENPTYEDMKTGRTGHAEAILVKFDPAKVSYGTLLDTFFRMHDPTTPNRQGNDIGSQYRSAIFYADEEQKRVAELKIKEAAESGRWKKPIVTQLVQAGKFYPAESYHQDYLRKNPGGYTCHYLRD